MGGREGGQWEPKPRPGWLAKRLRTSGLLLRNEVQTCPVTWLKSRTPWVGGRARTLSLVSPNPSHRFGLPPPSL